MKLKQRSKFWVVSTHILTSSFAIPAITAVAGFVLSVLLCALLDLGEGLGTVVALIVIMSSQVLGYIWGTYGSLRYLRRRAITTDWQGCIVPSNVTFTIVAFMIWIWSLIQAADGPAPLLSMGCQTLVYTMNVIAFVKITSSGFRELDEQSRVAWAQ